MPKKYNYFARSFDKYRNICKPEKQYENIISSAKGKTGELYLYGVIVEDKWFEEDITPNDIIKHVKDMGEIEQLDIFVNGPGGSIFAAHTIYSFFNRQEFNITFHIDGVAASAFSYLVQSGNEVKIAENGMFMIHDGWTFAIGNSKELRKIADDMDKINESVVTALISRGKADKEKIEKLMDEETWLTAEESVELGLADSVIKNQKVDVEKKENLTIINGVPFDASNYENFPELKDEKKKKPIFTLDEPKPGPEPENNYKKELYLYENIIEQKTLNEMEVY